MSRAGLRTACRLRTSAAPSAPLSSSAAAAERPLRVAVVVGSTRTKRVGGKVASALAKMLEARGHEVMLLDPRESYLDSDGEPFFMRLMEKVSAPC